MPVLQFDSKPKAKHMASDPAMDEPRAKRRKRAPVVGAADDCFTCSNRRIKCDRRRPYCSPCLDAGQDCAGYKTQLTWGVGVASRGKLRGLSLPVAGTKKLSDITQTDKQKKRIPLPTSAPIEPTRSQTGSPPTPTSPSKSRNEHVFKIQPPRPFITTSNAGYDRNSLRPLAARAPILSSQRISTGIQYSPISQSPSSATSNSAGAYFSPSLGEIHDDRLQLPPLSDPLSVHGSSYFLSGSEQQYQFSSPTDVSPMSGSAPTSIMSTNLSLTSSTRPHDRHQSLDQYDPSQIYRPIFTEVIGHNNRAQILEGEEEIEEVPRDTGSDYAVSDTLSITSAPSGFDMALPLSPFSSTGAVGKTPRMQYLIQYYAEVISPVIVAFDSQTNPMRNHILSLASKSDTLQHAISALSASNLRQRRECGELSMGRTLPARRSSMAHLSMVDHEWDQARSLPLREQRKEEVYHKFSAVQSLNQALANPNSRKDDSILASLLVLCLFHICDSGIARFQTQFAGIKKLLTLRRTELGLEDPESQWMTRLFIWFDAMSATVNDRESQFETQHIDASSLSDTEWSYETLTGVDGRLFKTMSKLGRLNILSQGKNAGSNPSLVSKPFPPMPFKNEFHSFDGNGWVRLMDDEDLFSDRTSKPTLREQFWREWREVRQQLQTFCFDPASLSATRPNGTNLTDDQKIDVGHISNAFRYSSLLYTERVANPGLPSSDERIQYWVRLALNHIQQVCSDVYLLWPLFITGSECVYEDGRDIIRRRCLDIQKDSGFMNNSSCLALLEKVWKVVPTAGKSELEDSMSLYRVDGHDHIDQTNASTMQQELLDGNVSGFRFRDVMLAEGNDGEWIVV